MNDNATINYLVLGQRQSSRKLFYNVSRNHSIRKAHPFPGKNKNNYPNHTKQGDTSQGVVYELTSTEIGNPGDKRF